jgi:cellulose biosynthesis protein BcsQ
MASAGKTTFETMIAKYLSAYKYSSIDIVKDMTEVCGIDRNNKNEKTRKLWSDIKQLLITYNDIPYKDVSYIVNDFNNDDLSNDLLLIDIREPEEIDRAKCDFKAITVLVVNHNVEHITSNNSDGRVFDYEYDYVVDNSGSLQDLEKEVEKFVEWLKGEIE